MATWSACLASNAVCRSGGQLLRNRKVARHDLIGCLSGSRGEMVGGLGAGGVCVGGGVGAGCWSKCKVDVLLIVVCISSHVSFQVPAAACTPSPLTSGG